MDTDPRDTELAERDSSPERNASDVVDGPIGDAHLVDPTSSESPSADLEALPAIDDSAPDAGDGPSVGDTP